MEKQVKTIEIRPVNVYDIQIDQNYQRVCHRSVNAIAADFDNAKFGVPKLSLRSDDTYFCIDGQHRIEAYKKLLGEGPRNPEIMCEVIIGLTPQEEAMLFATQGINRVAITPMEEMKAALYTGDNNNVYVVVHDILKEYGIAVVDAGSYKLGARCIRALRDRCLKYGASFITYYAEVLKRSGWFKEYDAYALYYVIAMTHMFVRGVHVDAAVRAFKKGTPSELLYQAQQYYKRTNVTSYDFMLFLDAAGLYA